jgi:hypothetical protein
LLSRSYYNLAAGDEDQGIGLERVAKKIHDVYTAKTLHPASKNRVALPPLNEIKRDVLLDMLRPDPAVNPEFQSQLRARLNLPADFGIPATNAAPATPGPGAASQPVKP